MTTEKEDKVIPLIDREKKTHLYRNARSAAAYLGIQIRTFYRRQYTRLAQNVEGYKTPLYDEADLDTLKAQLQRAKKG